MMKAVATAVETAERAPGQAPVQPLYLEALTLVERLHLEFSDEMIDTFQQAGPMLLDERIRQNIIRNYEASNEWVRAQWFPSRPVLFG